jgi:pimeloyl-ACP methyl ester carboxylesterase
MNLAPVLALCLLASEPASKRWGLFEWGSDAAPGILVNRTVGLAPTTTPDPALPTLLVVHGVNPLHPVMHITAAEHYADAVAARWGNRVNVLAWDWNGAAPLGVSLEADQHRAVAQGYSLAQAMVRTGLDPDRVHLIGQSSGCTLAAAAARRYLELTGRRVALLTLLDPVACSHQVIFDQLAAGSAAGRVEHYWVPGASGFGRPAGRAGVVEAAIPGPRRWRGLITPLRSDHIHVVQWHIGALVGGG